MDITIDFDLKSPDVIEETIQREADRLASEQSDSDDPFEEADDIYDELHQKLKKFIKYSEYIKVRIKIDGDAVTAEVIPI